MLHVRKTAYFYQKSFENISTRWHETTIYLYSTEYFVSILSLVLIHVYLEEKGVCVVKSSKNYVNNGIEYYEFKLVIFY